MQRAGHPGGRPVASHGHAAAHVDSGRRAGRPSRPPVQEAPQEAHPHRIDAYESSVHASHPTRTRPTPPLAREAHEQRPCVWSFRKTMHVWVVMSFS